MINIYPKNVNTSKKKRKKLLKRITDIEENRSVCDEQETSATENSMETHEKLFTIEPKLNIINKLSRPGQKGKKLSLTSGNETDVKNQFIETGPDGIV